MGFSGVALRQVKCYSGAGIDAHSSNPSFSAPPSVFSPLPAGKRFSGEKLRISSSRPLRTFGFSDNGHLEYYRSTVRCGGKKKDESLGLMTTKKKLKLLKGLLSEDLSMFSGLGSGSGGGESQDGSVGEVQGKLISESAEVLIEQLRQVRAREKEMKKNRKLEKAKLKAPRMKESSSSSSSSSSSASSSDSECGEVIDMSHLRRKALDQPIDNAAQTAMTATLIDSGPSTEEGNMNEDNGSETRSVQITQEKESSSTNSSSCSCSSSSNVNLVDTCSSATEASLTKSIEVCMGNKCKKLGGAALLEEFERVLGTEAAVVGCKCMGKCRDGPNVRVLNCVDGSQSKILDNDSVRTPSNPLCIGVSLADVAVIVSNFLGEDANDWGIAPAS